MYRLLVVLCIALLCGSVSAEPLKAGSAPPDDLGKTLAGQEIRTSALRGKVVVISFWATWCRYCLKELPQLGGLQALANERHLPLQVVAVNYKESHRTFVQASHMLLPKVPGLLLTWDRTGALAKSFGLDGSLPTMIMLHRDGSIAHVYVGYDESMLDPLVAEINQLMNEPAPPPSGQVLRALPASVAH